MGYVCNKVMLYKKVSQGDFLKDASWEDTGTELTNCKNVIVKKGIGKIRNTFSFELSRGDEYYVGDQPDIAAEDLVRIWMWRDSENPSDSDLEMQGIVRNVRSEVNTKKNVIRVKGNDLTESFFDIDLPASYQNKTCIEILRALIEEVRDKTGRNIYWDYDNNPQAKTDGSTFPDKNLVLNYTKVYEMLEKLTSHEYTEDGKYYYWVESRDNKNYFVLSAPGSTITKSFSVGEDAFDYTLDKNKDNVVNYVIFNCGSDLYNNAVESVTYDVSSIAKAGFKTRYMIEESTTALFSSYHDLERKKNISDFNPDDDNYPQDEFPTSYPYTFAIDGESVDNDKEFNNHLRELALAEGKLIADQLIYMSKYPFFEFNFNRRYNKDYSPGDIVQCDINFRNINLPFRLNDMSIDVGGVEYSFKQDEDTLSFERE